MTHVYIVLILDVPTNRYDRKLDKTVENDRNGVVNLRKLSEELPSKVSKTNDINKYIEEVSNYKQKNFILEVENL